MTAEQIAAWPTARSRAVRLIWALNLVQFAVLVLRFVGPFTAPFSTTSAILAHIGFAALCLLGIGALFLANYRVSQAATAQARKDLTPVT